MRDPVEAFARKVWPLMHANSRCQRTARHPASCWSIPPSQLPACCSAAKQCCPASLSSIPSQLQLVPVSTCLPGGQVRSINYGDCWYFRPMTVQQLDAVDAELACRHFNACWHNPAEFHLVFTGNFEVLCLGC